MKSLSVLAILSAAILSIFAIASTAHAMQPRYPRTGEWADIPLIVNVLSGADSANVNAAVEAANEILAQAHIRLLPVATYQNVEIGNANADLAETEGYSAQEQGQRELADVAGPGKGLKLIVAGDCWIEEPAATGWAVSRNPVVAVEVLAGPAVMGRAIAHQICHALALRSDYHDAANKNRLMYVASDGGTDLTNDEIAMVFSEALKRGSPYILNPRKLPDTLAVAIGGGMDPVLTSHGAVFDPVSDVNITDPLGPTAVEPTDPSVQYADVREVIMFHADPFDPESDVIIQAQLGSAPPDWDYDSFFDIFLEIDPESDAEDIGILANVPYSGEFSAVWHDYRTQQEIALPDPILHIEYRFGAAQGPFAAAATIEIRIGAELFGFDPLDPGMVNGWPVLGVAKMETNDYLDGVDLPLWIDDEIDFFEMVLHQPGSQNSAMFFRTDDGVAVAASGFDPQSTVRAYLGDRLAGQNAADIVGDAKIVLDSAVLADAAALHDPIGAVVQGASFYDETIPVAVAGYFSIANDTAPTADLDGDGDVDFADFTLFAQQWLTGK